MSPVDAPAAVLVPRALLQRIEFSTDAAAAASEDDELSGELTRIASEVHRLLR